MVINRGERVCLPGAHSVSSLPASNPHKTGNIPPSPEGFFFVDVLAVVSSSAFYWKNESFYRLP